MRAFVIYESMYGNTHLIADEIAAGLVDVGIDAAAIPVRDATSDRLASSDLVVIGGPTHVHGMSRDRTRQEAIADGMESDNSLHVDPDAEGDGLREWFEGLPYLTTTTMAAAFDTRIDMSAVLTGRASKSISKLLRHHGCTMIAEPESFFVTKNTVLEPDEQQRARNWGRSLGTAATTEPPSGSDAR